MPDKITPCLWYDLGQARAAAEFYVSLGLPDSRIDSDFSSPTDNPSTKAGEDLVVQFTLAGQSFLYQQLFSRLADPRPRPVAQRETAAANTLDPLVAAH